MSLGLPSVQAREGNRVTWQTQWWCSYVFAHKPRLRQFITRCTLRCGVTLSLSLACKKYFHIVTDMWGRVLMSCFSGAWQSLNFDKKNISLVLRLRDLIYAQSACNTPKRKQKLISHHMTPLIWFYNSHLFKCTIRHRSVSQWAGGICFRASCRASKRSSGSVSSDTNKNNQVKHSHRSRHICSVIVKQICRQQDFWILYE